MKSDLEQRNFLASNDLKGAPWAKSLIFALESGVLMDYYEIIASEHQQGEFVGFTNDCISASISKTELDQDLLVSYNNQ